MNEYVQEFRQKLDGPLGRYRRSRFITRAGEFHLDMLTTLLELRREAGELRRRLADEHDEDAANSALSLEYALNAFEEELKMWVALKADDANSAWDHLVNAQMAGGSAMQTHTIGNEFRADFERLATIENVLFPPQTFTSLGVVALHSTCSICGSEYGECDHVVGRAYNGEMCTRILSDIRINEVSLVSDPANKHARVTSISDDGVMRDTLTWRASSPQSRGKGTIG
jgi:hypothetical protein